MLAIETKDVWNEANAQILLSETKPHVVILPTEPSNLTQSVIITAELEENVAAKHRHCIHVGPLHENFRVPVIMGEKADGMCGCFPKTTKNAVSGSALFALDRVEEK